MMKMMNSVILEIGDSVSKEARSNLKAIGTALQRSDYQYVDHHGNGQIMSCSGVVMLVNGSVCPVFAGHLTDLCPMTLVDGVVHCASTPIAEIFDARGYTIDDAIISYNANLLTESVDYNHTANMICSVYHNC